MVILVYNVYRGLIKMRHNPFAVLLYCLSCVMIIGIHIYLFLCSDIIIGLYISIFVFAVIILIIGICADNSDVNDKTILNNRFINDVYSNKLNSYDINLKLDITGQEELYLEFMGSGGKVSGFFGNCAVAIPVSDINWFCDDTVVFNYISNIHRYSITNRNMIVVFFDKQYRAIIFDIYGNVVNSFKECDVNNTIFNSIYDYECFRNFLCYLIYVGEIFVIGKNRFRYSDGKCEWKLEKPSDKIRFGRFIRIR